MDSPVVLLLVQEKTSYKALEPIADELDDDCEIVVLFLKHIFEESDQVIRIEESDFDYRTISGLDYVRRTGLEGLPMRPRKWLLQQLVVNNLSGVLYDMDELFADVDPDLIIGTNDQVLYHRYVFEKAHANSVPTMALQHGFFKYELGYYLFGDHWSTPNLDPERPLAEKLKRKVLFRYGITQFCNPYTTAVLSLGDFFTDRISDFRSEYPTKGRGRVVTTGTPEFDDGVSDYEPECESVLFLSQQFLEGDLPWDWDREEKLADRLSHIDERLPVTVRPHPKDCREKIEYYDDRLSVSEDQSLSADIADHDVILSLDSTALIEGVVQGKVCGVLDTAFSNFEPFTHEHFLRIEGDGSEFDFEAAASERSTATQRDWLDEFCYTPSEDPDAPASSAKLIADFGRSLMDEE